ncbi:MAG: hypothetical protein NC123_01600 [Butyrivibrio sp.]|nr:hypothetical protein [Acetatifactor muris]MCM1558233.1 hypothetical protein [Butyrivibrio sp.]
MSKWNQRLVSAAVGMLLLLSLVYVGREVVLYTTAKGVGKGEDGGSAESTEFCVVIDAGHNGNAQRPKSN